MKHTLRTLTVVAFVFALIGSIGAHPVVAQGPSSPSTGSIDVSGNWQWLIIPVSRAGNAKDVTFEVSLKQAGANVTGNFDCRDCLRIVHNAGVKGTVKDGKLLLERTDVAYSGFNLTVSGDEITGDYKGRGNIDYKVQGKRVKQ